MVYILSSDTHQTWFKLGDRLAYINVRYYRCVKFAGISRRTILGVAVKVGEVVFEWINHDYNTPYIIELVLVELVF